MRHPIPPERVAELRRTLECFSGSSPLTRIRLNGPRATFWLHGVSSSLQLQFPLEPARSEPLFDRAVETRALLHALRCGPTWIATKDDTLRLGGPGLALSLGTQVFFPVPALERPTDAPTLQTTAPEAWGRAFRFVLGVHEDLDSVRVDVAEDGLHVQTWDASPSFLAHAVVPHDPVPEGLAPVVAPFRALFTPASLGRLGSWLKDLEVVKASYCEVPDLVGRTVTHVLWTALSQGIQSALRVYPSAGRDVSHTMFRSFHTPLGASLWVPRTPLAFALSRLCDLTDAQASKQGALCVRASEPLVARATETGGLSGVVVTRSEGAAPTADPVPPGTILRLNLHRLASLVSAQSGDDVGLEFSPKALRVHNPEDTREAFLLPWGAGDMDTYDALVRALGETLAAGEESSS